jgi:hypothetical protein
VKFTLEPAMKGKRWKERYGSSFQLNLGVRWGWVADATPLPLYHRE